MNNGREEGKQHLISRFLKRKSSDEFLEPKKQCVNEGMNSSQDLFPPDGNISSDSRDSIDLMEDESPNFPTVYDVTPAYANWKKVKEKDQVLFDTRTLSEMLGPFPKVFIDKWTRDHVKMPYSAKSILQNTSTSELLPKWSLIISSAAEQDLKCADDIANAIKVYQKKLKGVPLLDAYFERYAEIEEIDDFFDNTLPKMQKMLLNCPAVLTQPPYLLKTNMTKTVWMTQEQCAHVLVLCFFCCWPRREARGPTNEYAEYNRINFSDFFQMVPTDQVVEKLRCLLHYFKRVTTEMPNGVVSFERASVGDLPNIDDSSETFTDLSWQPIHIVGDGLIEDSGREFIQGDFANKYIGGGALSWGCVQEEIRFMICPELIVSQLLFEKMASNEAIIMTGAERFANYTGYSETFKFNGNHVDIIRRDVYKRRCTQIVAIDAINYAYGDSPHSQYHASSIKRDILKAFAGFNNTLPATIATGNWGCGAFGGDTELKLVIQMIAASLASRPLYYFCFDSLMSQQSPLSLRLRELASLIQNKSIPLVFELLTEFDPSSSTLLEYFRHC